MAARNLTTCQRQTAMPFSNPGSGTAAMLLGCVLLVCVGCSSSDDSSTPATTSLPPVTSTTAVSTSSGSSAGPTVVGAYGCGPADGRAITITARGLSEEPVVAHVVFQGEVRNRSEPLRGPDIEVTMMPDLPSEAYEPGAAQVRIVSGPEVIVSADVLADLPICG